MKSLHLRKTGVLALVIVGVATTTLANAASQAGNYKDAVSGVSTKGLEPFATSAGSATADAITGDFALSAEASGLTDTGEVAAVFVDYPFLSDFEGGAYVSSMISNDFAVTAAGTQVFTVTANFSNLAGSKSAVAGHARLPFVPRSYANSKRLLVVSATYIAKNAASRVSCTPGGPLATSCTVSVYQNVDTQTITGGLHSIPVSIKGIDGIMRVKVTVGAEATAAGEGANAKSTISGKLASIDVNENI